MKIARAKSYVAAARRAAQRALSLVEIMVVVALLSVIILGLVAMFDQTRRAFNSGLNQVDVLDGGRTAMDLMVRDMSQMMPAFQNQGADNFYVNVASGYSPVVQGLTDPNEFRTNAMETLYFLTRSNLQWSGVGYKVDPVALGGGLGLGTLYRYNVVISNANSFSNAEASFLNPPPSPVIQLDTNYSRILDGVVSLRIRAYDWNGVPLLGRKRNYNAQPFQNERFYQVYNDLVPAYVEVELGVLESRTLERWRSMSNSPQGLAYLQKHAGQVHIFRQRIPVRSVSPDAFQ